MAKRPVGNLGQQEVRLKKEKKSGLSSMGEMSRNGVGKKRRTRMPTAPEYRTQAKECLELANQAEEFYVKAALIELARKLNRLAHQIECRTHDTSASSLKAHSR